ncbi:MAG TPA: energy transducer TonB [Deltaproteobacteria bacterium]|nr:energy transducer TonB [Deltaproteobacteria bacterium]HOM30380.1 energy transducer TonB [Deltaproteobacteria bacterium]HPP79894.1 energy transducer TonB [Deltaproteobacteria bacterium]
MSSRMIVSLSVSALLHGLILAQPIVIFAKKVLEEAPPVRVRLVSIPQEFLAVPKDGGARPERDQEPALEEGVSFTAEGGVATGYLDRLKIKIFKVWEYPEEAILRGEEGKVSIEFVLNEKGELVDIGVVKSSGSPRLDKAALEAVAEAQPFGPLEETGVGKTLKVTGLFAYVLD